MRVTVLPHFLHLHAAFRFVAHARMNAENSADVIGRSAFEREYKMTMSSGSKPNWEHPLIRVIEKPFNRRTLFAGAVATAMAPSLRLVSAQDTPVTPVSGATPETELEGDDDAVTLLQTAVAAVSALKTFGFELKTTRGSSTIFQGFELKNVDGVVRRPMDIEATVSIGTPLGEISVSAVGIDGEFWVQDPLSDGEWISLGSDQQIQALINPDQLLLYAVRLVHDARISGTEKVDGVETTMVEGTVDFYSVLQSAVGEQEMIQQFLAEGEKDVTFWIDDQHHVIEGEIRGPIFTSESDDVVKVLSLFDFDKPVEIQEPGGA